MPLPPTWRFAFDGKPAPGDTVVGAGQTYSRDRGHGFEPGAPPNAASQPSFFSVDLPEGNYRVTVTLGGAEASDTTLKAELRRLMLDSVKLPAGATELQMAGSPVGVTLVHPGGVRTQIGESSRQPPGTTAAQVDEQRQRWQRLLVMPPGQAAARILRGIEQREPRVLVGSDAVQAAFLQRLFPVRYWALMARGIARRAGLPARAD